MWLAARQQIGAKTHFRRAFAVVLLEHGALVWNYRIVLVQLLGHGSIVVSIAKAGRGRHSIWIRRWRSAAHRARVRGPSHAALASGREAAVDGRSCAAAAAAGHGAVATGNVVADKPGESAFEFGKDIGGEVSKTRVAEGGETLSGLVSLGVKGLFGEQKGGRSVGSIGGDAGRGLSAHELVKDVGAQLVKLDSG